MMAILASSPLDRQRERGLGRFETAASPDRIPSIVLPLPAPMRCPLGHTTSMRWVDDDDSGATWQRFGLQAFINSGGRIRL
jgi:hypothetical protein